MIPESHRVLPTKYWHTLDDDRIQCDVCPRACKLREGQRGLCFVRGREDNQIMLYTWGRSSGFCIEPYREKTTQSFSTRPFDSFLWYRRL